MSKILIVTDLHFGAKNDNVKMLDYFDKFYSGTLFPYIDKHKIDTVFCLGDTFDRRKFINFNTLQRSENMFFRPLADRGINTTILVGNHDIPFRNTLDINAVQLMLQKYKFNVVDRPTEVVIKDNKICLIPWICKDNYQQSFKLIQETTAEILFGHLEIYGAEMQRGLFCHEGINRELFDRFDVVASGHFHHKSSVGNVNYLGAPYEMTWSDFNDRRGFHVFDLNNRKFHFEQNPNRLFHKIYYDDSKKIPPVPSNTTDCYIKLIVQKKNSQYQFERFVQQIEDAAPANIMIVEDHMNLNLENEDSIINEAEDTLTILNSFTDQIDINCDKDQVKQIIRRVYTKSMEAQ